MTNIITFDLDGTLMQNPFVKFVFPAIEKDLQDVFKRSATDYFRNCCDAQRLYETR